MKLGTYVDTWTIGDVRYIPESGCCCLLSLYSFFVHQFSNFKNFGTLFMRPTKLEHVIAQVDNGWMYLVYQKQAAAAYCPLFSFKHEILLSHLIRWMYCIYWNHAAAFNLFLYSFFFPIFKHQMFHHTFLRNWEAYCWKLTHTWTVCDVLCIPELGCCCIFVHLFLHFSLQCSKIKSLRHIFF